MNGGSSLGMTYGSIMRVMELLLENIPPIFSSITLGMGDGVIPAMFVAKGAYHVAGLELDGFAGHRTGQLHASRMIEATGRGDMISSDLRWGVDVLDITKISSMIPHGGPILAYGFDDSIPEIARRHWYKLLHECPQVHRIATCYNSHIDLDQELPEFREIARTRVTLEGGRCSRLMIILERH